MNILQESSWNTWTFALSLTHDSKIAQEPILLQYNMIRKLHEENMSLEHPSTCSLWLPSHHHTCDEPSGLSSEQWRQHHVAESALDWELDVLAWVLTLPCWNFGFADTCLQNGLFKKLLGINPVADHEIREAHCFRSPTLPAAAPTSWKFRVPRIKWGH